MQYMNQPNIGPWENTIKEGIVDCKQIFSDFTILGVFEHLSWQGGISLYTVMKTFLCV